MRIVVFGNDDGLGGAQVAFRRFLSFLEREPNVQVAAIAIGGGAIEPGGYAASTVISRIPPVGAGPIKIGAILAAALRIRAFSPDVFLSIGLARSSALISRLLHRNVRRIAFDFLGDRNVNCPLLSLSLKRFDELVVQAPSMRERLVAKGVLARPVSALPCFPGPDFPDLAKKGVASERELLRLAYFGRLADNKGIPHLIEAIALLGDKPVVTLDIWGAGPETHRIQESINRYALPSRVTLRGSYPGGRGGATLMAGYDAIVVPSQKLEGIPLVVVEAMAAGVPVLCTDIGALRDACAENPDFLLVDHSVSGLSDGIRTLSRCFAAGSINHDRLRAYYERNFSVSICERKWRTHLGLAVARRQAA